MLLAHIPLGLLPHIGNKIWALKTGKSRFTFLRFASVFGVTLGMLGLGGALARAVLGGRLYEEGSTPNEALPALFIELFPAWLAALIGVGILAAVMSTADGLVVSSSQIVANDLYRRTIAPRFHSHLSDEQLDRRVLVISRWATVGRDGRLRDDGLDADGHEHRDPGLDRQRRHDGCVRGSAGARRALERRDAYRRLHGVDRGLSVPS